MEIRRVYMGAAFFPLSDQCASETMFSCILWRYTITMHSVPSRVTTYYITNYCSKQAFFFIFSDFIKRKVRIMAILKVNYIYNNVWKGDFVLQRNHIYGYDEKGWLVTAVRRGAIPFSISVYRCHIGRDEYTWYKEDVLVTSDTGRAILEAAKLRTSNRVEFMPLSMQRVTFPRRLTTGRCIPYPQTYIPAGSRNEVRYNERDASAVISRRVAMQR